MSDYSFYLTISHCVYLNEYQRTLIGECPGQETHTIGTSIPVWVRPKILGKRRTLQTSEPAQEIICKYVVTGRRNSTIVEVSDDGYTIHLSSDDLRNGLLNTDEGGESKALFKYRNWVEVDGKNYRVVHFVVIKDLEELRSSLTH